MVDDSAWCCTTCVNRAVGAWKRGIWHGRRRAVSGDSQMIPGQHQILLNTLGQFSSFGPSVFVHNAISLGYDGVKSVPSQPTKRIRESVLKQRALPQLSKDANK